MPLQRYSLNYSPCYFLSNFIEIMYFLDSIGVLLHKKKSPSSGEMRVFFSRYKEEIDHSEVAGKL